MFCTETTQFYTESVACSSQGEAGQQSTRHSQEAPPSTPPGLLQECVCSAAPFDKGEDTATCPHLLETIFWPRFMSKIRTSHCCVLILVYSKASQPTLWASKRKDRRQKCRFKGDVPLLKIPGIREGGIRNSPYLRMMQAFDYLYR